MTRAEEPPYDILHNDESVFFITLSRRVEVQISCILEIVKYTLCICSV